MHATVGHRGPNRKYQLRYAHVGAYVSYVRETPPNGGIRLDLAEFDRLTALRGWTTDTARADALGISTATMSRIRTGTDRPGARFIHQSVTVLDVPYGVLFSMDDDTERVAS